MRRLCAVLGIALTLTSCGATPSPTPTLISSTPTTVFVPPDLISLLLESEELPGAWEELARTRTPQIAEPVPPAAEYARQHLKDAIHDRTGYILMLHYGQPADAVKAYDELRTDRMKPERDIGEQAVYNFGIAVAPDPTVVFMRCGVVVRLSLTFENSTPEQEAKPQVLSIAKTLDSKISQSFCR